MAPRSERVRGAYRVVKTLYIVPLEPALVTSTPTYDPFGTETTYKSKLFLCQMGHKQILT